MKREGEGERRREGKGTGKQIIRKGYCLGKRECSCLTFSKEWMKKLDRGRSGGDRGGGPKNKEQLVCVELKINIGVRADYEIK